MAFMNKPAIIRVVVVDDSALMRALLTDLVNQQEDMRVVGTAPDPLVAREVIRTTDPDVITLDVEMPKMDGLDFLDRLMRLRPTPVVMVSSLTDRGSEITMKALEIGAVDFVTKPRLGLVDAIAKYSAEIADKIRAAAMSKHRMREIGPRPSLSTTATDRLPAVNNRRASAERLIACGASTGGTEALREFLTRMPEDCPPIVIAQHMPPGFTASFAKRLDSICKIRVHESQGDETLTQGNAYIAPGHAHLVVCRQGGGYRTQLDNSDPVNRHRPSVDVLFRSVAQMVGPNAVGVIMTGMGKDGALGMLEMRRAGAPTFAQSEASCVVYGMPREAVAIGAADDSGTPADLAKQALISATRSFGHTALA